MKVKVTVKDLIGRSRVLAGRAGLDREVKSPQVSVAELSSPSSWRSIASSMLHIPPRQSSYLCSLPKKERKRLVAALVRHKPACIVLTGGAVCRELLEGPTSACIPVLKTGNLPRLSRQLTQSLAPRISLHGVLVEVFGLGTLILGESAIGKSEAALDLVLRGHRLVADDMVMIEKADGVIIGSAAELGAELLQIRGLGVVNVRALYGDSATAETSRIGLVVELEEWKKGHNYSLVGLRERRYKLLNVNLPYLKLPVRPGRNMATLIEVAARNQMLKDKGIFTARELDRRIKKRLTG